jgi:hypothetical protein
MKDPTVLEILNDPAVVDDPTLLNDPNLLAMLNDLGRQGVLDDPAVMGSDELNVLDDPTQVAGHDSDKKDGVVAGCKFVNLHPSVWFLGFDFERLDGHLP